MKTVTIEIYKFDELSEAAKQKAIQKHSGINVDYDWWSSTYEDAEQIGLKITSFDLERNRHAKGDFTLSAAEVAQNILSNHGEMCETYKTAQKFLEEYNPIFSEYMDENSEKYESSEAEEEMQDIEQDFLNSLLEDYSIILQNECDYLQSDEAIIETLIANEYEFEQDGTRY
jgi:hypothetical protein